MAKKGVPEWLNSSLWTSNLPPDNERLLRCSPKTSTSTDADVEPIIQPPVPEPQPKPVLETPEPEPRNSNAKEERGFSSSSAEDISLQAQLLAELSRKVIDMCELRRLGSQGIPDGAGIRSTVWKLLLGYLPSDRGLWSSELTKKRSQYKHFKDELLANPRVPNSLMDVLTETLSAIQKEKQKLNARNFRFLNVSMASQSEITRRLEKSACLDNSESKCEGKGSLQRSEVTHGEHPLSLGRTSIWNQFFQDTETIEQIDRDVKRTHPDMNFFSGDSAFEKTNRDALREILIIFSKLNPGIRYVQGMNEVLAPLLFVFRNDPDEENASFAEADAFFCFVELLSGFRDHFCQQLDNSVVGIRSTMTKLSQLLKERDEELWRHLEITTKVNPQFYAFRWITLLLTQEFNFADSLHIWDTILSDPEGPKETLLRICCAMLILVRRRLRAGDFTSNVKLLQNYPPTNISHLLYVANKLRIQSTS